jgi:hypothetical protein
MLFGIDLISAIIGAGIGLIFVTICISFIAIIANKIYGNYLLPEEESFKLLKDKIEPNISKSLQKFDSNTSNTFKEFEIYAKNLKELIDTAKVAIKEYVDVLEANKNLRKEIEKLSPTQQIFQIEPELMIFSDIIICRRYQRSSGDFLGNTFIRTPWGTKVIIYNREIEIDGVTYVEGSWEYFEVTSTLSKFFESIYVDWCRPKSPLGQVPISFYGEHKIDPVALKNYIKSIRAMRYSKNSLNH